MAERLIKTAHHFIAEPELQGRARHGGELAYALDPELKQVTDRVGRKPERTHGQLGDRSSAATGWHNGLASPAAEARYGPGRSRRVRDSSPYLEALPPDAGDELAEEPRLTPEEVSRACDIKPDPIWRVR